MVPEISQVINRLDRFESKIDKLSDAVLTIARVEERQSQHGKTMERIWGAMEAINARVAALESASDSMVSKVSFGERVWWIILTVGITASTAYHW